MRALFPALDAARLPERAGATEEAPDAEGEQTVLVVEDQTPLRAVTARILTRAGYRVLTAGNGPEALSVASATASRSTSCSPTSSCPRCSARRWRTR